MALFLWNRTRFHVSLESLSFPCFFPSTWAPVCSHHLLAKRTLSPALVACPCPTSCLKTSHQFGSACAPGRTMLLSCSVSFFTLRHAAVRGNCVRPYWCAVSLEPIILFFERHFRDAFFLSFKNQSSRFYSPPDTVTSLDDLLGAPSEKRTGRPEIEQSSQHLTISSLYVKHCISIISISRSAVHTGICFLRLCFTLLQASLRCLFSLIISRS